MTMNFVKKDMKKQIEEKSSLGSHRKSEKDNSFLSSPSFYLKYG